ncbi:MAG: Gfo/Idh/MocA family oxidoreductase, partial [Thaumarchaeota archaeon]|nr:Gfo/Idh/MocA family oxidoreductase [Nitrososphaerota archaeon]
MSKDQLRIGILGSGYMGKTYAECLSKYTTRTKLVAVHGGRRAPGLAKDYGIDLVDTYQALMKRPDIDAVIVATPPGNHTEQVVSAAEHGKHAMVEKPMAPTRQHCEQMIRAAEKAGVYLEVLQTQRWRSSNAAAKKTILEGKIGKVRMIRGHSLFTTYEGGGDWAKLPEHGGPHLDLNVHSYDMIRWLSGGEPTRVYADIKSFINHPLGRLTSMAELLFDNGVIAQQWSSMEMTEPSLPNSLFGFEVVGEKGIIDIDSYGKVRLGQGNDWTLITEFPKVDYMNKPMDPNRLQPFISAMQSFTDDILDHRPPTVAGRDG